MVNFSKHPTAKIYEVRSAISPPKIIQISRKTSRSEDNLLPFLLLFKLIQTLDSIFGQQLLFKRKHRCVSAFHLYRDNEPVSHRFYQRLMPF